MALRVGFVIDSLSLPAGGTEGQLVHLLERLDRERFAPHLYCLHPTDWLQRFQVAPALVLGIEVTRSPALLLAIRRFAKRLRQDRIDVLQTHFRDANLVGILAARSAGVPVLISTRRGVPYWHGKLDLAVLRWLNRSVHCFLANSQATRDRYAHEEGFDIGRSEVIYNGLVEDRFRAVGPDTRRRLRAELGVREEQPLVGIVANLRLVKGVDDFVRAAALVSARFPEARFAVIGQGREEAALRSLAQQLGLDSRLLFLGARSDVPELLAAFDVGVLASHFESFSNAILEYLAAGLPVVVTEVGGAAEVVEPHHGYLVPAKSPTRMAERIVELLAHPRGARAFRTRGGLPARYALPAMVAAHEELYSRLFAASQTPR